jgi:hypothetical protein
MKTKLVTVAPSAKVPLEIHRSFRGGRNPYKYNPHHSHVMMSKSLPFFRSSAGSYIHRVRSGVHFYDDGEYTHTALAFWCGMCGFAGSSKRHKGGGQFFETPPPGTEVCATCEGRAIGAGQIGSHKINGRVVKFSPRR